MSLKQSSKKFFRGWFPQEPTLSLTRSTGTKNETKSDSWALCPFLAPGALMIFAALLSACFGLTFSWYLPGGTGIYSAGFYTGIFSVAGSVIGLICGGLLLAGKHIPVAVTGLAVVFCVGLATVAMPILMGYTWMGELLVASPMIAFSAVGLIQVGLNSRKLRAYDATQEPKPAIETAEPKPINRRPVAAGLAAAGCGFILSGLLSYYLSPEFARMVPGIVIVAGAGLIAAAYLEKRTYKHGV